MPLGCEVLGRAVASRFRRGLYGGKQVLFGNNISEDGGNKTRRRWKPNAQYKKLYSEALDEMIPLRVTTYVIKCVDKVGGLDNYLLRQSDAALKAETDVGYNLKKRIQAAIAQQNKEANAPSVARST